MRLVLAVTVCASLLLTGCTTAGTLTPGGTAPPAPRPTPRCGWYTPMTGPAYGQVITIVITGPACTTDTLIRWVAVASGRPWGSTSIAPGTLIAQLAKNGTVIAIWQQGSAGVTDRTAGYLADALERAGWAPQVPACPASGCGPAPSISYTTYPPGSPVPSG